MRRRLCNLSDSESGWLACTPCLCAVAVACRVVHWGWLFHTLCNRQAHQCTLRHPQGCQSSWISHHVAIMDTESNQQLLAVVQEEAATVYVRQLEKEANEADTACKKSDEQLRLLKDQYRRLQADFDNFRSRAVRPRAAPC